jgi:hypothetical protein
MVLGAAMELSEALRQISEIRQQMAYGSVFRGYRSITVGFSGVLGITAAVLQSRWVTAPASELGRYLVLWLTVATVSLTVAGGEMLLKVARTRSSLSREMTTLAVGQFLPCLVIGGILTMCIYLRAQHVAWMLPGLWSLVFSLGVFASYRLLPRQAFWVGVYYAACGVACLTWGQAENALAPWQMALSFGGGQLLAASIIYWTLERTDAA